MQFYAVALRSLKPSATIQGPLVSLLSLDDAEDGKALLYL